MAAQFMAVCPAAPRRVTVSAGVDVRGLHAEDLTATALSLTLQTPFKQPKPRSDMVANKYAGKDRDENEFIF